MLIIRLYSTIKCIFKELKAIKNCWIFHLSLLFHIKGKVLIQKDSEYVKMGSVKPLQV